MMKAVNDTTVSGQDLVEAISLILPIAKKKDLGSVVISPASPAVVRLASFNASMDIPAEGVWTDAVSVSGLFLRNIITTDLPAAVRMIYFGGTLTLNGTSITASAVPRSKRSGSRPLAASDAKSQQSNTKHGH